MLDGAVDGGSEVDDDGDEQERTADGMSLRAGHLLLVEDDPDIGETVCEFVRGEGYGVTWAPDGVAALEHLRAGHRPALIVTDFMMPRLSGADLVQVLRRTRSLAAIPVVVVSAVPEQAVAAGVPLSVLVTKPVDLLQLMELVSRCCTRAADRPPGDGTRGRRPDAS
jgi:CheY-like chemotaxis protein